MTVRELLIEAGKVIPEMKRLADEATEAVRTVENFLSDLKVGILTEVEDPDNPNEPPLSYRRINGRYRIAVKIPFGDEEAFTPFLEASLEYKLRTIRLLPKLLQAINVNGWNLIHGAKIAMPGIQKIIEELTQ